MLCSLFQTPALDNCGTRLQDHRFAPLCTHADPAIDRDAAFIHCGSVYLALSISSHRLKSVTKTLRTARSQFIHSGTIIVWASFKGPRLVLRGALCVSINTVIYQFN